MMISIITVCFNSANTIEETIKSVLSQDYPQIQYIIIDGGSTDETLNIIKRYAQRIHTVVSEPDAGMYDAMNKGIALAKGEIIGLLHADDLYAHSGVISKIVERLKAPDVDACYGDLLYFSSKSNKVVRYWRGGEFVPGLFSKGWNPPHPTFFVRKTIYAEWGGFDTTYPMGNDIELMMRFLEKYKIKTVYIPELLVKMRLGGASNRALKNIIIQNKAILMAAKNLDIKISPWVFMLGKIFNRLSQFMPNVMAKKSGRMYRHVN